MSDNTITTHCGNRLSIQTQTFDLLCDWAKIWEKGENYVLKPYIDNRPIGYLRLKQNETQIDCAQVMKRTVKKDGFSTTVIYPCDNELPDVEIL